MGSLGSGGATAALSACVRRGLLGLEEPSDFGAEPPRGAAGSRRARACPLAALLLEPEQSQHNIHLAYSICGDSLSEVVFAYGGLASAAEGLKAGGLTEWRICDPADPSFVERLHFPDRSISPGTVRFKGKLGSPCWEWGWSGRFRPRLGGRYMPPLDL